MKVSDCLEQIKKDNPKIDQICDTLQEMVTSTDIEVNEMQAACIADFLFDFAHTANLGTSILVMLLPLASYINTLAGQNK